VLSVVSVTPYTLELNQELLRKARERMRRPVWMLALLQVVQSSVLLAVATALGLLMAHQIGLGAPVLEGVLAGKPVAQQAEALIGPAVLYGVVTAALMLGLEITFFWPRLPEGMRRAFPIPVLWKRFLACFYGGIAEELLCRLFLLSLLAWLLGRIWQVPGGLPAPGAFWLVNVLAALLFGLGHLPTTASLMRLTPLLIWRALLLNGVVGVAVGYLFWRYGLEAAMVGHFSADLVLHVIGDAIARKIRAQEAGEQG
jgi:membrane protease YdiL (CAAX protease family)